MSKYRKVEQTRSCEHCGRPVTMAGRRSKSGRYWCGADRCQAEKQKAGYRDRRGIASSAAPDKCSSCGRDLKPRNVRVGDIPGHRWCQRTGCQIHRQGFINRREMSAGMADQEDRIHFLHRVIALPRVTCPDCGVVDAIQGYGHPDLDANKCQGTGSNRVVYEDARVVFDRPGLLPQPEWQLRLAMEEAGRLSVTGAPQ